MWNVVEISQEVRTPQWYSDRELDALNTRLVTMIKDFHWIMDLLEARDAAVGHGMNIPKVHETLAIVDMLRKFGSLQNSNCDSGERRHKATKNMDQRIGKRSRSDDGGDSITKKVLANEMDAALHAAHLQQLARERDATQLLYSSKPAASGIFKAPCKSIVDIGHGEAWELLSKNLVRGKNGLRVPPKALMEAQKFANDWAPRVVPSCGQQTAFLEYNVYRRDRLKRILLPGHCVEL